MNVCQDPNCTAYGKDLVDGVCPATEHATAELRIWRALGRMPYLPLSSSGRWTPDQDLDRLADVLESFADALVTVGETNQQNATELQQLRSDLAAFRRVIGTLGS